MRINPVKLIAGIYSPTLESDARAGANLEKTDKPEVDLHEIFLKHGAYDRCYYKGGEDPMELARRLDLQNQSKMSRFLPF